MIFEKMQTWLFKRDEKYWLKSANPWNVWTRYSALPLMVLAASAQQWIGGWSLSLVGLVLLWMIFHPLFFSQPKSTRNWASKGVLGERVYQNRDKIPIPQNHRSILLYLLKGSVGFGFLLAIWATVNHLIWITILSIALTFLSQSWLLDRMVWLYEDMKDINDEYASWDY